ncbi:unnamed protein product [Ixodes hexagonus]
MKHNMTHACLRDVAAIFRKHGIDMPRDPRTILRTERRANIDPEKNMVQFGLKKGILASLGDGPIPSTLKLQCSIDGLPLYKSSSVCFWPILCRLTNVGDKTPFMVSLFCGKGKPPCLKSFLSPFLDELQETTNAGIVYKGALLDVVLPAVICDAPARSFIKCIKDHAGYSSCERCTVRGRRFANRTIFTDLDCPTRNDHSFRTQQDSSHHLGESPFLSADIDMVLGFPTEYMHLVCLGVVRKLLQTWVNRSGPHRLGPHQRASLTTALEQAADCFPSDFQRKPRGVHELERWKATEFRTFLLYVGPVVLRKLLPQREYEHFLTLHVAVRILASPELSMRHSLYAQDLLRHFVDSYDDIYGPDQMIYNVHTLSHLAEECRVHGALDTFSAFPFESFLGKLKGMLRTTDRPLSQISRRLSEWSGIDRAPPVPRVPTVKVGSCYLLDKEVVVVEAVDESSFDTCTLRNKRDFYGTPLPSSKLQVFRVDGKAPQVRSWSLSHPPTSSQCVLLKYKSGSVAVPFLHLQ